MTFTSAKSNASEFSFFPLYQCRSLRMPWRRLRALLLEMFVHRVPDARPCGVGQDAGHDGDQQRFGGGMLSRCPPRYPAARFWSVFRSRSIGSNVVWDYTENGQSIYAYKYSILNLVHQHLPQYHGTAVYIIDVISKVFRIINTRAVHVLRVHCIASECTW